MLGLDTNFSILPYVNCDMNGSNTQGLSYACQKDQIPRSRANTRNAFSENHEVRPIGFLDTARCPNTISHMASTRYNPYCLRRSSHVTVLKDDYVDLRLIHMTRGGQLR